MRSRLWRNAAAVAVALLIAAAAAAAPSWDGTWAGGWDRGDGMRIVIAGGKVIGVYRDGDDREILSSDASPDGSMLICWWVGGDGFLQRTGDRQATVSLRERDRPVRSFTVERE